MKKSALFAGLFLAFQLTAPAHAGPFDDLCGETLTENTTIRGVVETLPFSGIFGDGCRIFLATDVVLKVSSSEIDIGRNSLEIMPAASADGTQVQILSSTISNFAFTRFDANLVNIHNSELTDANENIDSVIAADDLVVQNSAFVGDSLRATADDSIKLIGSDFTIFNDFGINGPASVTVMSSNFEVLDRFSLVSEGDLVVKNSHVSAGGESALLVAAANNAHVSDNVLNSQIRGTQIEAEELVVQGNMLLSEDNLAITAVDDARVSGNVIGSFTNADITAGDLLAFQNNALDTGGSNVTLSGDQCRIKNNAFSDPQNVTVNCP